MQADLFNLSMSNSIERQAFQRSFFERKYTFRFDQLLAVALVFLAFFVLTFAWGVERGKAVSSRDFALKSKSIAVESPSVAVPPAPDLRAVVSTVPQAAAIEVSMEPIQSTNVVSQGAVTSEPAASAEASSTAKYTIAHMTYVKKEQAAKEIERIKAKGYDSFVVSSGKYYQLCVSGFESRKAANDAMRTLRTEGIVSADAYIRNMPAV
jgi:hypothetical protein